MIDEVGSCEIIMSIETLSQVDGRVTKRGWSLNSLIAEGEGYIKQQKKGTYEWK